MKRSRSRRLFAVDPSAASDVTSQLTLALLVPIISLGPMVLGGARTWAILPIYAMLLALLLVQACKLVECPWRTLVLRVDRIDVSVLLFLLYAIGRYLTATSEYHARIEVLLIGGCATLFWTARYSISQATHGLVILFSVLTIGTGVCLFAFYLRVNPGFLPYGESLNIYYAPRLTGSYGCPNHLGFFLVMACGIALAFGFFSDYSATLKSVCFYVAAFLISGILLTLSRGTWFGFAFSLLALCVYAVRQGRLHWAWPVAAYSLCLGGGVMAYLYLQDVAARVHDMMGYFQEGRFQEYVRIILARDALHIFRDFPWWGTGPATFVFMHLRYQDGYYGSLATFTHDDYLNLLADYGLVGFVLALFFIYSVTRRYCRMLPVTAGNPEQILWLSGLAAWSALLVHSVVDFNMHIPANALIFFTLTGLALRPSEHADTVQTKADRSSWITAAAVVLITIAAGSLVWKTAQGYYPLRQIQKHERSRATEKIVPALEEAATADPGDPLISGFLGDLYRTDAVMTNDPRQKAAIAQKAFFWYRRASLSNPLDDTLTLRIALCDDLMHRYAEAFLYYSQALKNQPHNGNFWSAFGSHYWRRGMIREAMGAYIVGTRCPFGADRAQAGLALLKDSIHNHSGPNAVEIIPATFNDEKLPVQPQELIKDKAPLIP